MAILMLILLISCSISGLQAITIKPESTKLAKILEDNGIKDPAVEKNKRATSYGFFNPTDAGIMNAEPSPVFENTMDIQVQPIVPLSLAAPVSPQLSSDSLDTALPPPRSFPANGPLTPHGLIDTAVNFDSNHVSLKQDVSRFNTRSIIQSAQVPLPINVPVPIDSALPIPVKVPVIVPMDRTVPYPVVNRTPLEVTRHVPVFGVNKEPYPVKVMGPVPYPVAVGRAVLTERPTFVNPAVLGLFSRSVFTTSPLTTQPAPPNDLTSDTSLQRPLIYNFASAPIYAVNYVQ